MSMRGLTVFIADLRNCRVRELEEKRINKLLYIYILGWDIDFGHMEAVTLISSRNFSEKQIGYLAVILLLTENHELVRLVVNSIRKDLEDLSEINNCLALHAIANIGAREMAESLAPEVYKLLISPCVFQP
ncbi:MAG: adaptor-related protein complex 2, short form [Olpidium bornovanus]|uniref:Adaptor-related protein complex 2, short form n=1 Tax=Olpidium bornovanus TaxID=278681 RepID=A0A8H8A246_9FUNG|nr:MAG: adaptor-related protein complex 2, short form [Olpidium bornovanus]